ncbi:uncharacterized protein LOC123553981 [Mercenaria mercenaria]|uniref:uncharacterized protein LOC123553981 n=1 Tax=Mercenaria mercenaria TaxID=6596 RepID=UPI00234E6D78|nr:uncharacterized protein LOC123553981 [Mercenaria mercenaria]
MILRTSALIVANFMFLLDIIQMKPKDQQAEAQKGPCVGMDCLHGVLMHNDDTQGEKHTAEDQYLRYKAVLDTENPRKGPLDAEAQMHGILMHGDSTAKEHHTGNKEVLPEKVSEAGPKDLSEVIHEGMHGEEGTHTNHDWNKEQNLGENENKGPFDSRFMHGVLMHGDINYEHREGLGEDTDITNDKDRKVGPQDAAKQFHGVMMHGDTETGKDHTHEEPAESKQDSNKIGPNNDLHGILMHGDSNLGHDHSNEDSKAVHDVFSDISKIKDLGLDDNLLKMINLEQILEKDRQEYADWIINNPQYQDESMMGSTLASVSDTILDDIELMKKRYLAKNNQPDEKEVGSKTSSKEEHPFTAEDARAIYDDSVHAEEGEDTRHDLELLGSTEPINARHKAKLEMLKSKLNK